MLYLSMRFNKLCSQFASRIVSGSGQKAAQPVSELDELLRERSRLEKQIEQKMAEREAAKDVVVGKDFICFSCFVVPHVSGWYVVLRETLSTR